VEGNILTPRPYRQSGKCAPGEKRKGGVSAIGPKASPIKKKQDLGHEQELGTDRGIPLLSEREKKRPHWQPLGP